MVDFIPGQSNQDTISVALSKKMSHKDNYLSIGRRNASKRRIFLTTALYEGNL